MDDHDFIGVPDSIVEALSLSTMKKDYNDKLNLYHDNTVKKILVDES